MKKKHIAWAVVVGEGNLSYIMDNIVFDKKKDAVAYRKSQGSFEWSDEWHVVKLGVMK